MVSFVTGGSRGIGREICILLVKSGSLVAFTYKKNDKEANVTLNRIMELDGKGMAIAMEVTDRLSVANAIQQTVDQFGGIDILVNNAGINDPCDFDQIEDNKWDEIIGVNLKGPFICSQEIIPFLRKRGGGSIINIGSVSGQYGGPRTAHYAASKAGLISLGQVVARFGAKDSIRCNTIAAGLIESNMASNGLQNPVMRHVENSILLQKLGTPDDIAHVVVFLASNKSKYITAQTINVNGGLYF